MSFCSEGRHIIGLSWVDPTAQLDQRRTTQKELSWVVNVGVLGDKQIV